jgi:predicted CXXCH cytochrome family protein
LRGEIGSLCTHCHGVVTEQAGKVIHPPAEDCSDCHETVSHGGQHPKFLPNAPPELCLDCHDDPREGEGELHPALEEGCLVCHDPHAGFAPGVLRGETVRAACVECHDDPLAGAKTVHEPASEGCATCHVPHMSGNSHFLKRKGNELCLDCHEVDSHSHTVDAERGVEKYPESETFPRSGTQYACRGCHRPHASSERHLIREPRDELCAQKCHRL